MSKTQETENEEVENEEYINPVDMSFMLDTPEPPTKRYSPEEARLLGIDQEEEELSVFSHKGRSVAETLRRIEGNKNLDSNPPEEVDEEADTPKDKTSKEKKDKKNKEDNSTKVSDDESDEADEEVVDRKPSIKEAFTDDDFKPDFEGFDSKEKTQAEEEVSKEDAEFISTLTLSEKQSLDVWKHAESKDPAYKGRAAKHLEYLKGLKAKAKELLAEDPDTPLSDNPDFEDWVSQHKPKVDPEEFQMLGQDYLIDQATKRAEKNIEEKYKPLKDKIRDSENKPKLEKTVQKYVSNLVDYLPDSLKKAYQENGFDDEGVKKVAESLPIETAVAGREFQETQEMGKSLMELRLGLAEYDKDNPVQAELSNKIIQFGKDMVAHPEGEKVLKQGDKFFMPREKFFSLSREEQAKHWTFSDQDLLELLAVDMKIRIENGIKDEVSSQETMLTRSLKSRGLSDAEIDRILRGANAKEKPKTKESDEDIKPKSKRPSREPGNQVSKNKPTGNSLYDAMLDPEFPDDV